ncbi:MAG: glycosyltransferase [Candidatus Bathyarchaeia archaeon]
MDNVEILQNVPFKNLLQIYGRAKIYLHAMKYEHFGISVVEAMAAGMVPVVHRSGGTWEDILEEKQGVHGFSYLTANEAAEIIEEVISNDTLFKEISSRNRDYVHRFSSESYKRNFLSKIEGLFF